MTTFITTRQGTVDAGVADSIFRKNVYRVPEQLTQADVCVDVGAHIGCFSILCLERGAGKVLAFEADPDNFSLLRRHLEPHQPRAECFYGAVTRSDAERPWRLHYSKCARKRNTGGGHVRAESGQSILTIGLDDVLAGLDQCAILKLDCEGSEWPILFTSKCLGKVQRIAGEYHGFKDADLCREMRVDGFRADIECLDEFLRAQGWRVEHHGSFKRGYFFAENDRFEVNHTTASDHACAGPQAVF